MRSPTCRDSSNREFSEAVRRLIPMFSFRGAGQFFLIPVAIKTLLLQSLFRSSEMAKLQCLACEAPASVIHSYHDENRFGS
jgi:hypothetical protein